MQGLKQRNDTFDFYFKRSTLVCVRTMSKEGDQLRENCNNIVERQEYLEPQWYKCDII